MGIPRCYHKTESAGEQTKPIVFTLIGLLSFVFLFIFLGDTVGLEWFGSPTLGMVYLIILVTVFYFILRNKTIKPSVTVIIWFSFLCIATTCSMIALAFTDFGMWEDFQAMPVMGTAQLVLWAMGIHFSLQNRPRKPLYLLTLWTFVLFLTTLITMIAMGFGLFTPTGGWEDWQIYPIIGTGIWSILLIVVYFSLKESTISWIDALFYFGWSMFIGITISMLCVTFILLTTFNWWPIGVIIATLGFALFFTILKFTVSKPILTEKLEISK